MLQLLLSIVVAASDGFSRGELSAGVLTETRRVPGSAWSELRLTALVEGDVEQLCARAFGTGRIEEGEGDIASRRVISQSQDERVTYDEIAPPLVSRRDYALRSRRVRPSPGVCRIEFEAANDQAPPPRKGWVRIEKLKGFFAFELQPDGKVKMTHQIYMEPGGQIPAWLAEGTQRRMSIAWMHRLAEARR